MWPICNMDGCFSAFRLVHGFHPAGEEASCISEEPGLAKTGIEPGVDKRFQKGLCTIHRRVFLFLVQF